MVVIVTNLIEISVARSHHSTKYSEPQRISDFQIHRSEDSQMNHDGLEDDDDHADE